MTNLEIKKEIDSINAALAICISYGTFTLNKEVLELTMGIKNLQDKCTHNFVDGVCEYCYKEKTDGEAQN